MSGIKYAENLGHAQLALEMHNSLIWTGSFCSNILFIILQKLGFHKLGFPIIIVF